MKKIITTFLVVIFSLLSIIHFYWGFGGKWGIKNALPANEQGSIILNPTSFDCFFVGFILMFFSLFYSMLFHKQQFWTKFFRFFIPLMFLLRAIGDFKFVGLFKTITNTSFAYLDILLYTPLCFFISFTGFYLLLKK